MHEALKEAFGRAAYGGDGRYVGQIIGVGWDHQLGHTVTIKLDHAGAAVSLVTSGDSSPAASSPPPATTDAHAAAVVPAGREKDD